ncbi:MAG: hypothetical protein AAFZ18_00155 [Myxococcota bacterium]
MRTVFWLRMPLVLLGTACGSVEFGEDQLPMGGLPDASPDLGADGGEPDLGPPDLGPAPDLGCQPLTLPTGLPVDWPFRASEAGYREVFWDWAVPEATCSGPDGSSACHGGGVAPFIPFGDQIGSRFQEGIDALWPLLVEAERLDTEAPVGRLWRHLPAHPDHVGPSYFGPVPARLDALLTQAADCQVADFLSSPPDAGVDCGPDSAPCFCEPPDAGMLMVTACAP